MLATANTDLKWIFVWNLYNYRKLEGFATRKDDIPDLFLELPQGYILEHLKWSNV